jgi:hypothetical protein
MLIYKFLLIKNIFLYKLFCHKLPLKFYNNSNGAQVYFYFSLNLNLEITFVTLRHSSRAPYISFQNSHFYNGDYLSNRGYIIKMKNFHVKGIFFDSNFISL